MLSDEAKAILKDMYSATQLDGAAGPVQIDRSTAVGRTKGLELHRLAQESGAVKSLEVGLANGFSAIWIMDGLGAGGSHIAIDPFQSSTYHGVGATQARRLNGKTFELIEQPSVHVLSDLARAGEAFDFIFIDGAHRFDDVVVDFYLADKVLDTGSILVLDDIWMASIRTVASFILANRAYEIVPQRSPKMVALRKLKDDARSWRHFQPFKVFATQHGGMD